MALWFCSTRVYQFFKANERLNRTLDQQPTIEWAFSCLRFGPLISQIGHDARNGRSRSAEYATMPSVVSKGLLSGSGVITESGV